jgi:hypothetical protein
VIEIVCAAMMLVAVKPPVLHALYGVCLRARHPTARAAPLKLSSPTRDYLFSIL